MKGNTLLTIKPKTRVNSFYLILWLTKGKIGFMVNDLVGCIYNTLGGLHIQQTVVK